MAGTLFVVATPIGNLEDITIRALRILRDVALIAAEDTRRTAHLLSRHAISTPTTSLHEHNEYEKTATILSHLQRGDDVALVSDAGTPTVSDPGAQLIRAARAAGVRVEPIPGPSAITAALSASGLADDRFTFMGFPPARSKAREQWFQKLVRADCPVVFFEAPHRIESTLAELQSTVGDCQILVARELTKAHEQLVFGPISAVIGQIQRHQGEFTVVVDIGHKTEIAPVVDAGAPASRRATMAAVAREHGVTANQLYAALELAKKSGK